MGPVQKRPGSFFRLSPAERETLGGFAVHRGDIQDRIDPTYLADLQVLEARYARPNFPLVPLDSITTLSQYGTSARSISDEIGFPVLRIPNLQEDGWDLSELKYLDLTDQEIARYKLIHGDILFNRTNGSRELIGKCDVFDFDGDWAFASYLIRLRLNTDIANPFFVSAFLNTTWGRRQVEHSSRQILMSNINIEEIRALMIPLPELSVQNDLLGALNAQKSIRDRQLKTASDLLSNIDDFILGALNLQLPPVRDPTQPFGLRRAALLGERLDPQSHSPVGLPLNPRGLQMRSIGSILAPADEAPPGLTADDEVPYVGLPECDLHEVREVSSRLYSQVSGRRVAKDGAILFARIEPSVFNRKYVFADRIGDAGWAFLSTEFYPVRALGSEADQKYLYALLLSDLVQRQVRGKTTGTSGRRRLDRDMFDSIIIPWPDDDERAVIAAEVESRRKEARLLRSSARENWTIARRTFEEALLGPSA